MQRLRSMALVAAVLIVAVVLFALLRPAGEDATDSATTEASSAAPTTATRSSSTPTHAAASPPAPKAPRVQLVTIAVRGGKILGGLKHAKVKQNARVALVVRADVADRVHLHGYDLERAVAPGKKARLVFEASVPGRFEIELEDRGLEIGELEVTP